MIVNVGALLIWLNRKDHKMLPTLYSKASKLRRVSDLILLSNITQLGKMFAKFVAITLVTFRT